MMGARYKTKKDLERCPHGYLLKYVECKFVPDYDVFNHPPREENKHV